MLLGSHPPEICLERGAFYYDTVFWAGAHLSEFPKGSGVGDGKVERAISSLKLVLEPSRVWRLSLGFPDTRDHGYLYLEDCRLAIGFRLSRQRLNSLIIYQQFTELPLTLILQYLDEYLSKPLDTQAYFEALNKLFLFV